MGQVSEHMLDVIIVGIEGMEGMFDGWESGTKMGDGVDDLHLHAGVRVGGHLVEDGAWIGQARGLEADHADGGGAMEI